jgi:dTDP-4-dehydrorhamnose 3,5-epimerase
MMMTTTTNIEGLLIIEPSVFLDERGYFCETFHHEKYNLPDAFPFVQDNEAKSSKGVLRGLHFQKGEHAQGKLVRVVTGSVYDVAVDLRSGSPSFGKSYGILLSGDNKKQLWVPRGFAHGYLVLEDDTIFSYKCDNYYHKAAEGGLKYDDPALNISWPSTGHSFIISDKDLHLPVLENLTF